MFAAIFAQKLPDGLTLADFAYTFSPLVEETAPDTMVIDVEGCELLFGSAYELASDVVRAAVKRREAGGLGCKVNVALAANPDAAIHAARFFKGITFISAGEELSALGELPIENLLSPKFPVQSPKSKVQSPKSRTRNSSLNKETLDIGHGTLDENEKHEILETLRLWGIRTFRDFAALPITGVSERLGQEGVRLQQLASGKSERYLKLKQAAPVFANSVEVEHPITEREPLSFILARLLNQLCASLNAYALATNELRVQMGLEDGTIHERMLSLPSPMRDHKVFLKLLLLDTEMHPPESAVVSVSITCEPVKPRLLQNGLFIPLTPEPEKLELTLARLGKLVGPANVGSPALIDTHRPDTFVVKKFLVNTAQEKKRGGRGAAKTWRHGDRVIGRDGTGRGRQDDKDFGGKPAMPPAQDLRVPNKPRALPILAFRVFRPPLRAMVEASRGYPTQLSAWGANRSVYGKIVRLGGPWRRTGDWWLESHWARDEWDVTVESGLGVSSADGQAGTSSPVLYRIYRELQNGWWFVEGIYD